MIRVPNHNNPPLTNSRNIVFVLFFVVFLFFFSFCSQLYSPIQTTMASLDTKQRNQTSVSSMPSDIVDHQQDGNNKRKARELDVRSGGCELKMDKTLLNKLMVDDTKTPFKKVTGTISTACKLAKKIKTPFVLHTTTRDLLAFLNRMSSMLEEMLFHINTTDEGAPFLEVKVVHPSKVCAVHAKFYGIHIGVDPTVSEQPLIRVSVQHVLNNCDLKIPSSPAQLIYDPKNAKLILVCVSQRTTFSLYTPTLCVEEELPKIEIAESKIEYALSVPLSVFRGGVKASSLKKEKAIQLTLIKTANQTFCLGLVHEDLSTIFISLNKADQASSSTSTSGTVQHIGWDMQTAETPDFDSIDLQNSETLFPPTGYSVSYMEKFLSSARGASKTIEVKLASEGPLFLKTGGITFVLSSYVDQESSEEDEDDEDHEEDDGKTNEDEGNK